MALAERGAEAVVTACEWHGRPAVAKHRNRRSYRHPDLETRLVVERLRAEARLLERAAGAGLPVPALYVVDPAAATLVMARLPGETLERALRASDGARWLPQLGELLARIHAAGIVHGDPTTSNFIAAGDGDEPGANAGLAVIDFGLGAATDDDEQRATDLRVMLESLEAHHPELAAREPLLAAYGAWDGAAGVLERLVALEQRGRYNLVRG
ncbi:MAG: Kae1-associated kinase Bud32 [Methanobacteriota archaeon]|nr:MAG: Kae1-associated kinase Bud32 [Euryarchaeota archaeon]